MFEFKLSFLKKLFLLFVVFYYSNICIANDNILSFKEGDNIKVFSSSKISIFNSRPSNYSNCRVIAKIIPATMTNVYVIKISGDWAYVCILDKDTGEYEYGYTPTLFLDLFNVDNHEFSYTTFMEKLKKDDLKNEQKALHFQESVPVYFREEKYEDLISDTSYLLNDIFIKNAFIDAMPNSLIGYLYKIRGLAYFNLNDYEQSNNDLNEALFYSPNTKGIYLYKSLNYLQMGKYSKAKNDLIMARQEAIEEGNERDIINIDIFIKQVDYEIQKLK